MQLLKTEDVIAIHEFVIEPNELQGMAADKSLESVMSRIFNRLTYGMISDAYELAACYACYIAMGHCFNDANKRTAHTAMKLALQFNGIKIEAKPEVVGDMIIQAAQGIVDDNELAQFLRAHTTFE